MLLVGTDKEQAQFMAEKYKQKFIYLPYDYDSNKDTEIIKFIEQIKINMLQCDITFINYNKLIITLLNKLNILYTVIKLEQDNLDGIRQDITIYNVVNNSYEQTLCGMFSWMENINDTSLMEIPENKNKLTFEQLLQEDVSITEADVRSLKETQNKLKVGMLLQAKNSLNRVLKLTNVLDKLYDELVNRLDVDISTTDTASIMYTADYISKALQDTNKLIVDLINNDKIQNFFIIDNSQTLNISDGHIIGDDRADINSREKIRKAAEIVLRNIDLFQQGNYMEMKNPNNIYVDATQEHNNLQESPDNIQEESLNDNTTSTV